MNKPAPTEPPKNDVVAPVDNSNIIDAYTKTVVDTKIT